MKTINSDLIQKFLEQASQRLKGDWVLIGGTLLPALGIDVRTTTDIDLVGMTDGEQSQSLELMEISESLGLGVETINQAASFFFRKLKVKHSELILLRKGSGARIYRPGVELYWKLKIPRMTESDLMDCIHYLNYCAARKEEVDRKRLKSLVSATLEEAEGPRRDRLTQLLSSL